MLLLQERSKKFEQENKFMAEALEDLQDSTSRLEAENRTLKMGASSKGRIGGSSGSSGKVRGARLGCTPSDTTIFARVYLLVVCLRQLLSRQPCCAAPSCS